MPILKAVDLADSEFVFDWPPNSEDERFGRFRRPAEPSTPTGGRFGRLWRDSRLYLQKSENEANLLVLVW